MASDTGTDDKSSPEVKRRCLEKGSLPPPRKWLFLSASIQNPARPNRKNTLSRREAKVRLSMFSPRRVKSGVFVCAAGGSRRRSGAAHRWRSGRTSHAGGTNAATCYFSHLVIMG
ncbi:uncharacterized protein V6R79_011528 [Siganus canaliculatus]